jgi:hypothetical protein
MPSFIPGKVTARLPPSLLTSHEDAENADTPRRILPAFSECRGRARRSRQEDWD